jgi:hypothetical protein
MNNEHLHRDHRRRLGRTYPCRVWLQRHGAAVPECHAQSVPTPRDFNNVGDGQGAYCSFSWDADEQAAVSEGHAICDVEIKVPADAYTAAANYLQSRHLPYSRVQINTQLIAAENTLCKR